VKLQGDWDTGTANVLEIYFERCDSVKRSTCKNETEFNQWVDDKQFIFTVNSKLFMAEKFGEERFLM